MPEHSDVIIDAHQHIWDKSRADYPWLTQELAPVDRVFTFDELRPQLDACDVTATVLVQSADNLEDTELMLACAADEPRVAGVVGWVPLDQPDRTAELLERWASTPVVRGIRNLIHDRPDPRWLFRDDVREGLALLERSGLTFDVVAVLPDHLEAVLDLSERYPDLPLVIDHLGHPPIDLDGPPDGSEPWWDLFAATAANPRVRAKVSGLYPTGDGTAAQRTEEVRRVVDHAFTHFGADRLMYGGDWPISVLHGGYGITWDSLRPLFDGLTPAERTAVLAGTATAFYGLDPQRVAAAHAD
ncbi:L-fuconolactonase [Friedmanniella endophytica]|uniref:L-fuconolactonase n=1 Tax=Microlunatus kandeliicorticis TaxID=1759536 RepID=A0A7W3IPS2_9ACTN|nr:amidohydrolase family protein [Microlunatus kandeliicorticis]MBA8792998.1 L-fuconolactonase [Microlunatus kandeliicorticis]